MAAFKKVIPIDPTSYLSPFQDYRIKGLWPWPLTSSGHPKWSSWALYIFSLRWVRHRNFCCSWHFTSKSTTLIFNPKVKSHGADRKPMGTFLYDLYWIQHRISHHLATNHPRDHPTANHPTKDKATTCVAIGPVCNSMYCSLDLKM